MSDLKRLAEKFGMAADSVWLAEAFTHRSYAAEHHLNYDNQRLEFLGDAVLEIIFTEYLFKRYPDEKEGELTKLRSALAREATLAGLARALNLGGHLRLGNGEKVANGPERNSTLADLFEAFIGALYLENGFDRVRNLMLEILNRHAGNPRELLEEVNPKGQLQELSQRRWNEIPHYNLFFQNGPQHRPYYEVEVTLNRYSALGGGRNRKLAEFDAAARLFAYFQQLGIR